MGTAMFPLGSALVPGMPLDLRVFEARYLVMLQEVLQHDEPEFGVVLIERGREAGGGDVRFPVGTIARILEVTTATDEVFVRTIGTRRVEVSEWLDDDPYPVARTRELDELAWDDAWRSALEATENHVRRTMTRLSEFVELPYGSDWELADDPVLAAWQLAGVSPLGSLDRYHLLRAASIPELLAGIREAIDAAALVITAGGQGSESVEDDFP